MTTPAEPPVLLVHGLGSSFEHNWKRTGWVDVLGLDGRHVLGFDLPGHGSSTVEPDGDVARRELITLLDAVGPVDAVGFSAGAVLLATVATERPQAFRRLALLGIGDGLWRDDRGAAVEELALALENDAPVEGPMPRLFRRMTTAAGNDAGRVARYLRSSRTVPALADLASVSCPTLVVLGDRDPVGPADRMTNALTDAQSVVLKGADHFATTTDIRCQDIVSRFLADEDLGVCAAPAC
jgi:pimeloyl-ACP methyl ester carboxylesterase